MRRVLSSSISYARLLEEESEDRVGVEGRYAVTIIAYRLSIRVRLPSLWDSRNHTYSFLFSTLEK